MSDKKIERYIVLIVLSILLGALGTCIWWNVKSDKEIEEIKLEQKERKQLNEEEKEKLNKKLTLKRVEYYISIWLIVSLSLRTLWTVVSLFIN